MSIRIFSALFWIGVSLAQLGCARDPTDELIEKLHNPNVEVRRVAARALVEHPPSNERVIEELMKCTSDKDTEVRYQLVDALGKAGPSAKSSLPLLRLRLQDQEKKVRRRAAFSIQKIDPSDRSFVPVLTAAMREGDGRTLLEVGALESDAGWAVPTLIGLLSHESPKVRTVAARVLGNIGPAAIAAKPALETASRDSTGVVQRAAKDAMSRLERQHKPAPAAK